METVLHGGSRTKMGIGFDLTGIFGGAAERAAEFAKDARSLHSRLWLLACRRLSATVFFPDVSQDEGRRADDEKGGRGYGRSV